MIKNQAFAYLDHVANFAFAHFIGNDYKLSHN